MMSKKFYDVKYCADIKILGINTTIIIKQNMILIETKKLISIQLV